MDWNKRNSRNKNKTNSPSSLIQDGKTITDQKHIAEPFNNSSQVLAKNYKKTSPQ